MPGIIKRHGFGQCVHAAFRCGVSCVDILADNPNHAGGVQHTTFARDQCRESMTGRKKNAFQIHVKQRIPFRFGGFMNGL